MSLIMLYPPTNGSSQRYMRRLPISVRYLLTLDHNTSKLAWTSQHAEYWLMQPYVPPWSHRNRVIEGGGLRLVKEFYTRQMSRYIINGAPRDAVSDLVHAIMCGHEKIFWYLCGLYEAVGLKNWDVTDGLIISMVTYAHYDWINKLQLNPIFRIPRLRVNTSEDLMVHFILLRDKHALRWLFTNGVEMSCNIFLFEQSAYALDAMQGDAISMLQDLRVEFPTQLPTYLKFSQTQFTSLDPSVPCISDEIRP